MADCIFCKIINQEIPSKIIAQNDDVIVIQDISPKAPIHYLIVPKEHIADIRALKDGQHNVGAAIFAIAQQLSQSLSGLQDFRLIMNNGSGVGQSVFHMHAHFLSGKKMTDF